MDAALKKKWITALRSGRYRKCRHVLADAQGRYCAIGVLLLASGAQRARLLDKSSVWSTGFIGLTGDEIGKIEAANDIWGFSFKEIADYIEKEL